MTPKILVCQLAVQLQIALAFVSRGAVLASDDHSRRKPKQRRRLNNNYFNIRLFWKEGYRWQESRKEKKFCMQCAMNRCPRGSRIKVTHCDRDDWRQHFSFDEGRIRSRRNRDACLERDGRSVVLGRCGSSRQQVWGSLSKEEPFQLRIPGDTRRCASQHHHPKDGEKIYMTSCKRSAYSQTDKWVVY